MKLQYLGTAAAEGWPALFCTCPCCEAARKKGGREIRTRSQAVLDDQLLIDFPPDTYHHVLTYGLNLPQIRHLIVTHSHQDHFYPDDLFYRSKGCAANLYGRLGIYGNEAVEARWNTALAQAVKKETEENQVHGEFYHLEPGIPKKILDYEVTPLLANHKKDERCYIYMIEKEGKRLLYGHDTGWFPQTTWEYIKGRRFDLVSLDCTMQKIKDGNNHMGIADDLEVKKELEKIGCADSLTKFVMNHFSHNGGVLHEELEEIAGKAGFLASFDGMTVEF